MERFNSKKGTPWTNGERKVDSFGRDFDEKKSSFFIHSTFCWWTTSPILCSNLLAFARLTPACNRTFQAAVQKSARVNAHGNRVIAKREPCASDRIWVVAKIGFVVHSLLFLLHHSSADELHHQRRINPRSKIDKREIVEVIHGGENNWVLGYTILILLESAHKSIAASIVHPLSILILKLYINHISICVRVWNNLSLSIVINRYIYLFLYAWLLTFRCLSKQMRRAKLYPNWMDHLKRSKPALRWIKH